MSKKLLWQEYDRGGEFAYCADGDGIVVVVVLKGKFGPFGIFVADENETRYSVEVFDQGDEVAAFRNLDDAFALAEKILQEDYPAIYADCLQDALNSAFVAFQAEPANTAVAAAYQSVRDALWQALNTQGKL